MALIKTVNDKTPSFGDACYLSENTTIIGDVVCGDQCSFWFQSVIRGDVHEIRLGDRVNIQDGAIIHGSLGKAGTYLKDDISVGHGAILHGCKIESRVLIGMRAVVMDNAIVNSDTIVAAGAVVTENMVLESNAVYAGVPAKKVKSFKEGELSATMKKMANNYLNYSSWYE